MLCSEGQLEGNRGGADRANRNERTDQAQPGSDWKRLGVTKEAIGEVPRRLVG